MATYYLNADTGDNGNDGSEALPWLTVLYAATQVASGDVLVCQDSVAHYIYETIDFTINEEITIQGGRADASGAIFDAGGGNATWINNNGILNLTNITFRNNTPTSIYAFGEAAQYRILNCKFFNFDLSNSASNRRTGLFSSFLASVPPPYVFEFVNCSFLNVAFRADGNRQLIVATYVGDEEITTVFQSCTIHCTNTPEAVFGLHNTSHVGAKVLTIVNSILTFPSDVPLLVFNSSSYNILNHSYSCFHNISGYTDGGNNITSDPLLVDPENGDCRLRPASPCIDGGTLL